MLPAKAVTPQNLSPHSGQTLLAVSAKRCYGSSAGSFYTVGWPAVVRSGIRPKPRSNHHGVAPDRSEAGLRACSATSPSDRSITWSVVFHAPNPRKGHLARIFHTLSAATCCEPIWRRWPCSPRRTVRTHTARLGTASAAWPDWLSRRLATKVSEISGPGPVDFLPVTGVWLTGWTLCRGCCGLRARWGRPRR